MRRVASLVLVLLGGLGVTAAAQDARVHGADERLGNVEAEIQALWRSYYTIVKDDLPNTKASLDCGTGQYEEIKPTNSYLVFFVACERIEPHLDGFRASIAIGNPHTFGFARVSGSIGYGENLAAALVKGTQRVEFTTASELRPGTWLKLEVPITPAQQKDVAKIVFQFEAAGAIARGDDPVSTADARTRVLAQR
jgi:hypothetical protein